MQMVLAHGADCPCVPNWKPSRNYRRREGVKRNPPQEWEAFHFAFFARFRFAFIGIRALQCGT